MHRRLIQLTKTSRLALAVAIVGGVLAGLCSLAQAHLLSATVDGVFLDRQTLDQVSPWLRLLLGVIIARGILLGLQETAAAEVAVRIKQDLRERLFAHLLRLGPSFASGQRSGELASTAVDGIEALDAYFSQFLPQLAISLLVPGTILLVVFPLDPLSGAILLLTAPLIPFFMYMIGRTAETATTQQYESLGRLSAHLLDSVQGLTTLKLFGQATAQVHNIARVADQFRRVTMRVLQVSFLSAFALELLATISTAIIAVEVGLRLLYGDLAFRQALFLLILAPEFYLPLRLLGMRFHAGMSGTAAARRIFEILETPAPDGSPVPPAGWAHQHEPRPEQPESHQEGIPAIRLRDVAYSYPGREVPALQHVDLTISGGEHVAIVGPSGAGKTTLVSLLLGFITPTHGEIIHAGPLRPSWVPQDPHLFHTSITDNIRLGMPEASAAEVARAARLAHLEEFVETLPDRYETIIGEGGARLSSGERQRLALARALLVAAPVIVLDEPSSSLDPENERLLEESLHSLSTDRTLIVIAHRLRTVERMDRIVVLDHGRIAEQGTHSALLGRSGLYAQLVQGGIDELDSPSIRLPEVAEKPRPVGIPFGARAVVPPPLESPSKNRQGSDRAQRFLPLMREFLRGSGGWIALSVLLGTLTIGSSVALMGTSAWLISAAALHPSIATLGLAIVGVRFFGISRAVFRYLERLVSHGVTFRLLRNIRVWLYSRLEPLAPARLMDFRLGDVVTRLMADVETLENLFVRVLAPPLTALWVLAGTCAFLILSGAPQLALLLVGMFGLAGVLIPFSARHFSRHAGSRMIEYRASLEAQLVDAIHGMADLVAFGRLVERQKRVQESGAAHASAQRTSAHVGAVHSGLASIAVNSALLLALILVIPLVSRGSANGIMLASFALIVLASSEAVVNLPLAGQLWPAMQSAGARILGIVNVAPAAPAIVFPPASEAASSVSPSAGADGPPSVEFTDVTVTYPGRSRPALRGVSFGVAAGRSLAIVGPSGSGKSTIGNVLLRFWEIDAGEITLGGRSLRTFAAEDVRSQIGFASQHPYFFDTSVFENLRLARRGVSRAEVERAAQRAEIHEFICSLPRGYDTLIGEHGARLSAGERQRLGIARLIIKDAPFLLLDEPTANLDALTEAQIFSMLLELMSGRTSLLITHRLLRMQQLDEIIVMDHGVRAERGRHAALLASGGLYARLWELQNRQPGRDRGPLAEPA